MFKLIFFIYILFNFDITQVPNEIHVRYNDQTITFGQITLELMGISNIDDLIETIKLKLRKDIENVSEKAVTFCHEQNEDLNSDTPISELYNTKNSVYEVV